LFLRASLKNVVSQFKKQLTDLNDLPHTNDISTDDVVNVINDVDHKIDVIPVPDEEDLVEVDDVKVYVENNDVFTIKYKPTTSMPDATSEKDDNWSSYPTRPSRPTKPTVRWPTFHATSSHLTSSQYGVTPSNYDDEIFSTTETSQRHSYVHFPQAVTRPTKQPPTPIPVTPKTTARPLWTWEDKRSTKTTPPVELETSTTTTTTTTTTTETEETSTTTTAAKKPYFPSSSASDSNAITGQTVEWNKKGRPTRPTRPPKPSTFDLVTYFPPLNGDQPLDDDEEEEEEFVAIRTTPQTTSTTITTTTTRTTTTTELTTTTALYIPTTRPPMHIMPPPRLSATTLSTPGPPRAASGNAQPTGGCGVPVLNKSCPKARIVNGTQSCYGQFPWQVRHFFLFRV